MNNDWKYFTTNYKDAWNAYKKSSDYRASSDVMRKAGIKQPYRNNILQLAFAAGWNATGVEIKLS